MHRQYYINLPGEYFISATFNAFYLSPFDVLELRTNSFEEGGDDMNMGAKHMSNEMDANITLPSSPIIRAHAKKIKILLQHLAQRVVRGGMNAY